MCIRDSIMVIRQTSPMTMGIRQASPMLSLIHISTLDQLPVVGDHENGSAAPPMRTIPKGMRSRNMAFSTTVSSV